MRKALLDSAEGMEILDQNSAVEFTLWPFSVILSNHRRSCGHQTSFWDHSEIFLAMTVASCWSKVISDCAGARIDSRICRSDYETGRWEALKLKLAQMESDACSANRHQPTAGCLKASDLWELDGYGNCCLTGFVQTHGLHEYAHEYTHRFLALMTMQTLYIIHVISTQIGCNSTAHSSTNSVSSVVHIGRCTLLFAFQKAWSTRESR